MEQVKSVADPIECADCHEIFYLTPREQGFYAEMMAKDANWTTPKRCKPCRDKRKSGRPNLKREDHMRNYD